MIKRLTLLLSAIFIFVGCNKEYGKKTEKSLVIISSSMQSVTVSSPWNKNSVVRKRFYGVFVSKDTILTSSEAVGNWVYLEMSRFGSEDKFELDLLHVDYEINLALLKVKDSKSLKDVKPVKFSSDLEMGDEVRISTLNRDSQIIEDTSTLTGIKNISASTSSFKYFAYKFSFAKKGLNNAEPIFIKDKLAGIITSKDDSFEYATPGFILKRFVKQAIKEGKFTGFPSLGFDTETLHSRVYRKFLGVPEGGVRLIKINPNGAFANDVKNHDMLIEVDKRKIDEYGFVEDSKWGRVHYLSYLNFLEVGKKIQIKITRKSETLDFKRELKAFNSNERMISRYRYNEKEPHLIFGGIVFQELSFNYLAGWGKEWWKKAPSRFVQLWNEISYSLDPASNRIIVVNRVLADRFNRGYRKISDEVVKKVNNQSIHSIADLRKALEKPVLKNGKKYMKIDFSAGGGGVVILGYEELAKAHERIAGKFDVDSSESFYNLKKAH